jgi:penicillin amidase
MVVFRALKYVVLILVVIAVAVTGYGAWIFNRALPDTSGSVLLSGLTAPVSVIHDEHGVPHIFARDMNDAARTLGYLHASERLFQMEMNRRAGQGRLSEVLGSDMLGVDKFIRTLGLYQLAAESFDALSPDAQKMVQAYGDGVNTWMATHKNQLPPEFLVLGITPEPWKPADSLVWAKLMALQLSHNYKLEMLRAELMQKLSPAEMNMLFPRASPGTPVTLEPRAAKMGALNLPLSTTIAADESLGALTGLAHGASNEWAISGARTETGKPILANDPHLGLEAPILWYLARIKTPDLDLVGATVPGLPVVLLGQNGMIAWGFTTTGSDVEDLFVETIDPQNPDHYLAPGGTLPFETRKEIIHVKGAADVELNIRVTRHGPVLSDVDPEMAALAGTGKVMALAFTALEARDATSEALMRINQATNCMGLFAALHIYLAPPQNVVCADTTGNIGFVAAGRVPLRKKGDGTVPADGASGDYDWTGVAAPPQLFNPPAGFIFNANNAVVSPEYPFFLGTDWEEPYRARRLQQIFDTVPKFDLDTSAMMQADHVSLAAHDLLPYLLRQKPSDAAEVEALDLLRSWNGTMDKDKPEPLIFEAWMAAMHRLILEAKTGDPLREKGPYDASALTAVLSSDTSWCPTKDKSSVPCDEVIEKALSEALAFLRKRHGTDMLSWRWGDEHVTLLTNKFYSHLPGLAEVADFAIPASGDFYTLDRGGGFSSDPNLPFARTHAGGYRGIYDLGDPSKSRFMIATGESGHIFSAHYGDLVGPWSAVEAFTLAGSQEDLEKKGLPEMVFTAGK